MVLEDNKNKEDFILKIFVDFETNSLNGELTELAMCDTNIDPILFIPNGHLQTRDWISLIETIKSKSKIKNKDIVFIFWHRWHLEYLKEFYNDIYNSLKGCFACFIDFYSIMLGNEKKRYPIQDCTSYFLNRQHLGNAKNDCQDLRDCWIKSKEKLSQIN